MSLKFFAAAAIAVFTAGATAHAAPYTAAYVFGDSLSDNGNLAEAFFHQNLPNPPSYHDSFTNGPVATQLLAQSLGLSLNPSLWVTGFTDPFGLFGGASFVPGTNYAVAGATAAAQAVGGPAAINLPQQIGGYTAGSGGHADPNALYIVMIGGNDVRNAARQGTGAPAVTAGVQAELGAVQTLAAEGASKFLIVNVPNVGVIPEFTQDNPTLAAAATQYSVQFNMQLHLGLAALTLPPTSSVTEFDLFAFNSNILANAATYGLTNTTDRCYTATPVSAATSAQCGPGAANIDQFAYWDAIHPTKQVQALWAQGFEQALGIEVPEPPTAVLLTAALVGMLGLTRRSRA